MTTASELTGRRCEPCEGGVPPLETEAVAALMKALNDGWTLASDGLSISRRFEFAGYHRTEPPAAPGGRCF